MTNPERFDEHEFWCKEGEEFWRQIVPPEEDRTLFTTALWRGEFRWFRSPNVVALEHYRRPAKDHAPKSDVLPGPV
jgi:hypothetical protein